MLGGSVCGLLSLAAEAAVGTRWCRELWQAASSGRGDTGSLSGGPSAAAGIQKVLNKLVLNRWRPGPFPRESHCLGGGFGADSQGE